MGNWTAVVGAAGSNKYEFVKLLSQRLRASGLSVAGFAQPLARAADGTPFGWDIENLATGERLTLARPSSEGHVCNYAFEPGAFEAAALWLDEPSDVVIADGVGKLEAAGSGHWAAVSRVIARPSGPLLVIGIRDTCLTTIALSLPDPQAHIQLPVEQAEAVAFAETVAELAQGPNAADRTA
jgi:nucleoside-triphosphatase THEP1